MSIPSISGSLEFDTTSKYKEIQASLAKLDAVSIYHIRQRKEHETQCHDNPKLCRYVYLKYDRRHLKTCQHCMVPYFVVKLVIKKFVKVNLAMPSCTKYMKYWYLLCIFHLHMYASIKHNSHQICFISQ